MPFAGSFWIITVLPFTIQPGTSPLSTHSCNASLSTECRDGSLLNQKPLTPSGPGAFQFAILRIPFLTSSISIITSSWAATSANISLMSFNQLASRSCSISADQIFSQNSLDSAASGISLVLPLASPPSSLYSWLWLFWKRLFCLLATLFSTYQRIFTLPACILFFRKPLTANAPLSVIWYRFSNSLLTLSRTLLPFLISSTLAKSFRHRPMFPSILLCHQGFLSSAFLPFPNLSPNLLATTTPAAYNSLLIPLTSMFGLIRLCIRPSTNSTSARTLFLSAALKLGTFSHLSPFCTPLSIANTFFSSSFKHLTDPSASIQLSTLASITTIGSASILPSSGISTTKSTSCLPS